MAVRLTACFIVRMASPEEGLAGALTASRRIAMIPRSPSGHPGGGEGSTMTRRAWRFGGRRCLLLLVLLLGARALLIRRGAPPLAWAADPTGDHLRPPIPL